MPQNLDVLLHHVSSLRRQAESSLREAAPQPPAAERTAGLRLAPGTRVLDQITGQEGEVIAGRAENYIVPTTRG
jgi:hypothetical protein